MFPGKPPTNASETAQSGATSVVCEHCFFRNPGCRLRRSCLQETSSSEITEQRLHSTLPNKSFCLSPKNRFLTKRNLSYAFPVEHLLLPLLLPLLLLSHAPSVSNACLLTRSLIVHAATALMLTQTRQIRLQKATVLLAAISTSFRFEAARPLKATRVSASTLPRVFDLAPGLSAASLSTRAAGRLVSVDLD